MPRPPESRRQHLGRLAAGTLALCPLTAALGQSGASAQVLRVDYLVASGAQRTAWTRVLAQFQREHPDIAVQSREFEQERYKRDFERRVARGECDVAFWFAGERLRRAIRKGLVAPLEGPALLHAMREGLARPLLDAVRMGTQTFGVPLSYYPWGFLYRRSLFERWGVTPPATWPEFLALCERLRSLGVVPTAVGAQEGWPAAAWFDYLNLRLHGLEAHRQLLATDPELAGPVARRVLTVWQGLLKKGYFHPATTDQGWASVLPYLYRGEIGMALLGSFALARVPAALRGDIGFFGFPTTELPAFEEAPVDVLVVPATSRHRPEAERFLTFLARSDALTRLAQAAGELSPRLDAPPPEDLVLREGRRVLERAAGLSFFFDRDAPQDMVEPAFQVFGRLMLPPHDLP